MVSEQRSSQRSVSWKPAKAWTSSQSLQGRRHFRLVLHGGRGAERWVELASVIKPEVRLRQRWTQLCDPAQWQSGWRTIPSDDSD